MKGCLTFLVLFAVGIVLVSWFITAMTFPAGCP